MSAAEAPRYEVLCCAAMGADLVFSGLDSFPAPGREAYSQGFAIMPGGGANMPYALHRLGLKAALVSGLGADELGGILRRFLENEGLATEGLVPAVGTAVSAVMPFAGDRGFATWLPPTDWDAIARRLRQMLPHSGLLHTSSYNCAHLDIAELCEGTPFTVDACWHDELTLARLEKTLRHCRVFFINEAELEKLTEETDREKALQLLAGCTRTIVLKLGAEGCVLCENGQQTALPALHAGGAVDATGAGDAFCAGFLYGLARGCGLEECGRLANACGAVAVAQTGGLARGLTRQQAHGLAGVGL